MEPDTHPVQTPNAGGHSAKLPTTVTMICHVYAPQEAMVTGGCRGGFSTGELIAFLYAHSFPKEQWRMKVDEAFHGMQCL